MPKRYRLFQAPVLSFFSRAFYDDVARRWKGVGYLYLFLLLALTWALVGIGGYVRVADFLDGEEWTKVIDQIPAITIRDGVATADVEQPYYMRDDATQKVFAVIDTTGTVTEDNIDMDEVVLLTESKVFMIQRYETKKYDLSEIKAFDFDGPTVRGWADDWFGPVWVGGVVVCVIFSFIYRAIQVLIYGALGLGFAAMMGKSVSYAGSVRIAVMAITPVIVIDTLLSLVWIGAVGGCAWWVACLVIALAYIAWGISSITNDQADPAVQEPWDQPVSG